MTRVDARADGRDAVAAGPAAPGYPGRAEELDDPARFFPEVGISWA